MSGVSAICYSSLLPTPTYAVSIATFILDDDDDDGVANIEDNCPPKPNPDQADGDNNGIGDACEELMFSNDFDGDSSHLNGTLLKLICEFDKDAGWSGTGILSCAHWLRWKCGMSKGSARKPVRVARALPELPAISAAFCKPKISQYRLNKTMLALCMGQDIVSLGKHTTEPMTKRIPNEKNTTHLAHTVFQPHRPCQ